MSSPEQWIKVLPRERDAQGQPVSGRMIEPGIILSLGSGEARSFAPFLERIEGFSDAFRTVSPFWLPCFRDARGSGKMVLFIKLSDAKKYPWLEQAGAPFTKLNKADERAAALKAHNELMVAKEAAAIQEDADKIEEGQQQLVHVQPELRDKVKQELRARRRRGHSEVADRPDGVSRDKEIVRAVAESRSRERQAERTRRLLDRVCELAEENDNEMVSRRWCYPVPPAALGGPLGRCSEWAALSIPRRLSSGAVSSWVGLFLEAHGRLVAQSGWCLPGDPSPAIATSPSSGCVAQARGRRAKGLCGPRYLGAAPSINPNPHQGQPSVWKGGGELSPASPPPPVAQRND